MKLGKFSLAIVSTLATLSASAQIYNTGYNTSLVSGQLVDNLWTVTALANTPGNFPSSPIPAVPYPAFTLPNSEITWPWDLSAPVGPGANSAATLWDSNQHPAFGGSDTSGMITTYTLNFVSPVSGVFNLYFEADNYVDMYKGAVSLANRFYSEQPAHNGTDFLAWQSTPVNVAAGANQLNIVVYNYPFPTGNYTGLRVNFQVPVPEPSTFALVAGGFAALLALKRRK